MMHDHQVLIPAAFVSRPNRFVAKAAIGDTVVTCHMPNPGRMWELLYEGTRLYLRKAKDPARKTPYDVVGIEREGIPILLDTQYNNDVAEYLIQNHLLPFWESCSVIRREVTVGDSRFDLLLEQEGQPFYVEVKSCTLFGRKGAMFPDAVTERGRKHIEELAAMHDKGIRTGLLILAHWNRAEWFLPDYHTDPAFAEAFRRCAPRLDWKAFSLSWDETFTYPEPGKLLSYPETLLIEENKDAGDYFLVLELAEDRDITVGSLGRIHFPKGFYVYVGSAKKNLMKRLERHKRKRKGMHWHIDYFRNEAQVLAALPVRTQTDLEHLMARDLIKAADWFIPHFGATDCTEDGSHLFGFRRNPLHEKVFMDIVEGFRMNRLDGRVLNEKG
ncbi:MAG: DNA/RNA nuclease SfsA [Acidaminococcus sp.]|uniref:Sugar fermentation stimulation protein homolog n=1 Tax=Acidaminococcus intestini TaxID=187327 RepID=A0A943I5D7_9FIRM|nr:DNA/RNA nuclease SfsA [Acidaminococcus sp.]MBS5519668.1 DNA/RNA nuclease SfsA [Acidaminococcus intestini]MDY2739444.1 DNA/RNA nuclease SfsA [Acidaminococcus sp.]